MVMECIKYAYKKIERIFSKVLIAQFLIGLIGDVGGSKIEIICCSS